MACSIVTTVASASANSYSSIADATTYHDTHLYASAWENASDDERCRALQMATRMLDQWFDWAGSPVGSTQALAWPRVGAVGPNGYELASDAIPVLIARATAELGRQLISADRTADSDLETQGLSQLTAGSVSMAFRSTPAKPIPDAVLVMVSPLGTLRARSGSAGVTVRRA